MELKELSDLIKREVGSVSRLFTKHSLKQGLAPGQLLHVGKKMQENTRITVIDYTENSFEEITIEKIQDCFPFRNSPSVTWINIDGIHDTEIIEIIGNHFGLHPLVMEDIVNTGQRPKVEFFDDYIYLVVKMLNFDDTRKMVTTEQVSFILGNGFVLSFQEKQGDVFDPVRQRIRTSSGRVRKCGPDYLAYVLVDAVVDEYFSVIEKTGEMVDALDNEIMESPTPSTSRSIQRLRTELILVRKAAYPLRESISSLQRTESKLLTEALRPYLGDLHDHAIQVADATEMLRDLISSLRDTYLTSLSNKTNEVMKLLTIISTIFIPITFIAGIYGMNFENMPELKWPNAYFYTLGLMGVMVIGMLAYFRKKDWI